MKRTFYDDYYLKNEWKYDSITEYNRLKLNVLPYISLASPKVIEIGCGLGFHTNLWHSLNYDIVGYDSSIVAINKAKECYPNVNYVHFDVSELSSIYSAGSLDVIYCRGLSWYHYELNGINTYNINITEKTEKIFHLLQPNGKFILEIITDHTGSRPANEVHNNTLNDYLALFNRFGTCLSARDWYGQKLSLENLDENLDKIGVTLVFEKRCNFK